MGYLNPNRTDVLLLLLLLLLCYPNIISASQHLFVCHQEISWVQEIRGFNLFHHVFRKTVFRKTVFLKTVFRKTVFRKTVFRKIKKKIKKMGKFFPKFFSKKKKKKKIYKMGNHPVSRISLP